MTLAQLTPPPSADQRAWHDDLQRQLNAMTDDELIAGMRWRLDAIAANYARARAVQPVQAAAEGQHG